MHLLLESISGQNEHCSSLENLKQCFPKSEILALKGAGLVFDFGFCFYLSCSGGFISKSLFPGVCWGFGIIVVTTVF